MSYEIRQLIGGYFVPRALTAGLLDAANALDLWADHLVGGEIVPRRLTPELLDAVDTNHILITKIENGIEVERRLSSAVLAEIGYGGEEEPEAQTLTPGLVTDTDSFAAPTASQALYYEYQTTVSSGVDGTTFTFEDVPIGPAVDERRVIVGTVQGLSSVAVSSITIGGVSASVKKAQASGTGNAEIWLAEVPANVGTTADIVVTWGSAVGRSCAAVWAAYNLSSDTPVDTDGGNISTTANGSDLSLTTTAGGFVVGIGMHSNFTSGNMTWRNMTERYDEVLEAQVNTSRLSVADAATSGTSLTVGLDLNGGGDSSPNSPFAVASFF